MSESDLFQWTTGDDQGQRIAADTVEASKRVEARANDDDLQRRFEERQKMIDEARKISEDAAQDTRERILTSSLSSEREEYDVEAKDLADTILGLKLLFQKLNVKYDDLDMFSDEEKALISRAERDHDDALREKASAEQDLVVAKAKTWLFWIRSRAVKAANERIQVSNSNIEPTKARIEEAKQEAERRSRKRLRESDFEASFQRFEMVSQRAIDAMADRERTLNEQFKIVSAQKTSVYEVKQKAADRRAELEAELQQAEAELQQAEEELVGVPNGTPEYATQSAKVSEINQRVEEIRGNHNTALALYQSKEAFAEQFEAHLSAQLKLRDALRMWITILRSDTEERKITLRSRLEAMKGAKDQEVAKQIDKVGVDIDLSSTRAMAAIGAAAERAITDKIEEHPEVMRELALIQAAQAEAHQEIRERFSDHLKMFEDRYGIDPLGSSFFTYESSKGSGDSPVTTEEKGTGNSAEFV